MKRITVVLAAAAMVSGFGAQAADAKRAPDIGRWSSVTDGLRMGSAEGTDHGQVIRIRPRRLDASGADQKRANQRLRISASQYGG